MNQPSLSALFWSKARLNLFVRMQTVELSESSTVDDLPEEIRITAFKAYSDHEIAVCSATFVRRKFHLGLQGKPTITCINHQQFAELLAEMHETLMNWRDWFGFWDGERRVSAMSMIAFPALLSFSQALYCMNFSTHVEEQLRQEVVKELDMTLVGSWRAYRQINC